MLEKWRSLPVTDRSVVADDFKELQETLTKELKEAMEADNE